MTGQARIFIQIAAYRDPELLPTLESLFARASLPENISAGICWQYKPGSEPEQPASSHPNLRWRSVPYEQSKGVCWARHEVQKLYDGEEYTLMIDSHMRFVQGWDTKLIEELTACANPRAVITHHPPVYAPPDKVAADPRGTVLCPGLPNQSGDIRLRGEPLDGRPDTPLKGAFASPGFLFAPGKIIQELPYDPHLYFDQEEMCLSARIFTHGWDVYHPRQHFAYHLYDSVPVSYTRHKHWADHPEWGAQNRLAMERRDHLLGYRISGSEEVLRDLDAYGHGDVRSLEEFGAFCGIDFAERAVSPRALRGEFIPQLEKYRRQPIAAPQQARQEAPPPASADRPRVVSAYMNVPVENFRPASRDILSGLPCGGGKPQNGLQPSLVEAPPGVLVIENYASPDLCKRLMAYADQAVRRKLEVVDHDMSTRDKVVTRASSGRITDQVSINGMAAEIVTLFTDIYANRMAPFYGATVEWFERPQILRYSAGGRYDPHADADHYDAASGGQWLRTQDRDLSVLLYLNEEYEGGEIGFDKLGFEIKPRAGMLLGFPADHRYLHAARPTRSGLRYTIVSWAASVGSPRVRAQAPYASVFLHVP